jgi:hypothetical protein
MTRVGTDLDEITRVAQSKIKGAGYGLFATTEIRQHQAIGKYPGVVRRHGDEEKVSDNITLFQITAGVHHD